MPNNIIRYRPLFAGSGGNATYLQVGEKRFLIDVGSNNLTRPTGDPPVSKLQEALVHTASCTFNQLDGIIITHNHTDHIGGLLDVLQSIAESPGIGKVPVYMMEDTWNAFSNVEETRVIEQIQRLMGTKTPKFISPGKVLNIYTDEKTKEEWNFVFSHGRHDTPGGVINPIITNAKIVDDKPLVGYDTVTLMHTTDTGRYDIDEILRLGTKSEVSIPNVITIEYNHFRELALFGNDALLPGRIISDDGHASNVDVEEILNKLVDVDKTGRLKKIYFTHGGGNTPTVAEQNHIHAILTSLGRQDIEPIIVNTDNPSAELTIIASKSGTTFIVDKADSLSPEEMEIMKLPRFSEKNSLPRLKRYLNVLDKMIAGFEKEGKNIDPPFLVDSLTTMAERAFPYKPIGEQTEEVFIKILRDQIDRYEIDKKTPVLRFSKIRADLVDHIEQIRRDAYALSEDALIIPFQTPDGSTIFTWGDGNKFKKVYDPEYGHAVAMLSDNKELFFHSIDPLTEYTIIGPKGNITTRGSDIINNSINMMLDHLTYRQSEYIKTVDDMHHMMLNVERVRTALSKIGKINELHGGDQFPRHKAEMTIARDGKPIPLPTQVFIAPDRMTSTIDDAINILTTSRSIFSSRSYDAGYLNAERARIIEDTSDFELGRRRAIQLINEKYAIYNYLAGSSRVNRLWDRYNKLDKHIDYEIIEPFRKAYEQFLDDNQKIFDEWQKMDYSTYGTVLERVSQFNRLISEIDGVEIAHRAGNTKSVRIKYNKANHRLEDLVQFYGEKRQGIIDSIRRTLTQYDVAYKGGTHLVPGIKLGDPVTGAQAVSKILWLLKVLEDKTSKFNISEFEWPKEDGKDVAELLMNELIKARSISAADPKSLDMLRKHLGDISAEMERIRVVKKYMDNINAKGDGAIPNKEEAFYLRDEVHKVGDRIRESQAEAYEYLKSGYYRRHNYEYGKTVPDIREQQKRLNTARAEYAIKRRNGELDYTLKAEIEFLDSQVSNRLGTKSVGDIYGSIESTEKVSIQEIRKELDRIGSAKRRAVSDIVAYNSRIDYIIRKLSDSEIDAIGIEYKSKQAEAIRSRNREEIERLRSAPTNEFATELSKRLDEEAILAKNNFLSYIENNPDEYGHYVNIILDEISNMKYDELVKHVRFSDELKNGRFIFRVHEIGGKFATDDEAILNELKRVVETDKEFTNMVEMKYLSSITHELVNNLSRSESLFIIAQQQEDQLLDLESQFNKRKKIGQPVSRGELERIRELDRAKDVDLHFKDRYNIISQQLSKMEESRKKASELWVELEKIKQSITSLNTSTPMGIAKLSELEEQRRLMLRQIYDVIAGDSYSDMRKLIDSDGGGRYVQQLEDALKVAISGMRSNIEMLSYQERAISRSLSVQYNRLPQAIHEIKKQMDEYEKHGNIYIVVAREEKGEDWLRINNEIQEINKRKKIGLSAEERQRLTDLEARLEITPRPKTLRVYAYKVPIEWNRVDSPAYQKGIHFQAMRNLGVQWDPDDPSIVFTGILKPEAEYELGKPHPRLNYRLMSIGTGKGSIFDTGRKADKERLFSEFIDKIEPIATDFLEQHFVIPPAIEPLMKKWQDGMLLYERGIKNRGVITTGAPELDILNGTRMMQEARVQLRNISTEQVMGDLFDRLKKQFDNLLTTDPSKWGKRGAFKYFKDEILKRFHNMSMLEKHAGMMLAYTYEAKAKQMGGRIPGQVIGHVVNIVKTMAKEYNAIKGGDIKSIYEVWHPGKGKSENLGSYLTIEIPKGFIDDVDEFSKVKDYSSIVAKGVDRYYIINNEMKKVLGDDIPDNQHGLKFIRSRAWSGKARRSGIGYVYQDVPAIIKDAMIIQLHHGIIKSSISVNMRNLEELFSEYDSAVRSFGSSYMAEFAERIWNISDEKYIADAAAADLFELRRKLIGSPAPSTVPRHMHGLNRYPYLVWIDDAGPGKVGAARIYGLPDTKFVQAMLAKGEGFLPATAKASFLVMEYKSGEEYRIVLPTGLSKYNDTLNTVDLLLDKKKTMALTDEETATLNRLMPEYNIAKEELKGMMDRVDELLYHSTTKYRDYTVLGQKGKRIREMVPKELKIVGYENELSMSEEAKHIRRAIDSLNVAKAELDSIDINRAYNAAKNIIKFESIHKKVSVDLKKDTMRVVIDAARAIVANHNSYLNTDLREKLTDLSHIPAIINEIDVNNKWLHELTSHIKSMAHNVGGAVLRTPNTESMPIDEIIRLSYRLSFGMIENSIVNSINASIGDFIIMAKTLRTNIKHKISTITDKDEINRLNNILASTNVRMAKNMSDVLPNIARIIATVTHMRPSDIREGVYEVWRYETDKLKYLKENLEALQSAYSGATFEEILKAQKKLASAAVEVSKDTAARVIQHQIMRSSKDNAMMIDRVNRFHSNIIATREGQFEYKVIEMFSNYLSGVMQDVIGAIYIAPFDRPENINSMRVASVLLNDIVGAGGGAGFDLKQAQEIVNRRLEALRKSLVSPMSLLLKDGKPDIDKIANAVIIAMIEMFPARHVEYIDRDTGQRVKKIINSQKSGIYNNILYLRASEFDKWRDQGLLIERIQPSTSVREFADMLNKHEISFRYVKDTINGRLESNRVWNGELIRGNPLGTMSGKTLRDLIFNERLEPSILFKSLIKSRIEELLTFEPPSRILDRIEAIYPTINDIIEDNLDKYPLLAPTKRVQYVKTLNRKYDRLEEVHTGLIQWMNLVDSGKYKRIIEIDRLLSTDATNDSLVSERHRIIDWFKTRQLNESQKTADHKLRISSLLTERDSLIRSILIIESRGGIHPESTMEIRRIPIKHRKYTHESVKTLDSVFIDGPGIPSEAERIIKQYIHTFDPEEIAKLEGELKRIAIAKRIWRMPSEDVLKEGYPILARILNQLTPTVMPTQHGAVVFAKNIRNIASVFISLRRKTALSQTINLATHSNPSRAIFDHFFSWTGLTGVRNRTATRIMNTMMSIVHAGTLGSSTINNFLDWMVGHPGTQSLMRRWATDVVGGKFVFALPSEVMVEGVKKLKEVASSFNLNINLDKIPLIHPDTRERGVAYITFESVLHRKPFYVKVPTKKEEETIKLGGALYETRLVPDVLYSIEVRYPKSKTIVVHKRVSIKNPYVRNVKLSDTVPVGLNTQRFSNILNADLKRLLKYMNIGDINAFKSLNSLVDETNVLEQMYIKYQEMIVKGVGPTEIINYRKVINEQANKVTRLLTMLRTKTNSAIHDVDTFVKYSENEVNILYYIKDRLRDLIIGSKHEMRNTILKLDINDKKNLLSILGENGAKKYDELVQLYSQLPVALKQKNGIMITNIGDIWVSIINATGGSQVGLNFVGDKIGVDKLDNISFYARDSFVYAELQRIGLVNQEIEYGHKMIKDIDIELSKIKLKLDKLVISKSRISKALDRDWTERLQRTEDILVEKIKQLSIMASDLEIQRGKYRSLVSNPISGLDIKISSLNAEISKLETKLPTVHDKNRQLIVDKLNDLRKRVNILKQAKIINVSESSYGWFNRVVSMAFGMLNMSDVDKHIILSYQHYVNKIQSLIGNMLDNNMFNMEFKINGKIELIDLTKIAGWHDLVVSHSVASNNRSTSKYLEIRKAFSERFIQVAVGKHIDDLAWNGFMDGVVLGKSIGKITNDRLAIIMENYKKAAIFLEDLSISISTQFNIDTQDMIIKQGGVSIKEIIAKARDRAVDPKIGITAMAAEKNGVDIPIVASLLSRIFGDKDKRIAAQVEVNEINIKRQKYLARLGMIDQLDHTIKESVKRIGRFIESKEELNREIMPGVKTIDFLYSNTKNLNNKYSILQNIKHDLAVEARSTRKRIFELDNILDGLHAHLEDLTAKSLGDRLIVLRGMISNEYILLAKNNDVDVVNNILSNIDKLKKEEVATIKSFRSLGPKDEKIEGVLEEFFNAYKESISLRERLFSPLPAKAKSRKNAINKISKAVEINNLYDGKANLVGVGLDDMIRWIEVEQKIIKSQLNANRTKIISYGDEERINELFGVWIKEQAGDGRSVEDIWNNIIRPAYIDNNIIRIRQQLIDINVTKEFISGRLNILEQEANVEINDIKARLNALMGDRNKLRRRIFKNQDGIMTTMRLRSPIKPDDIRTKLRISPAISLWKQYTSMVGEDYAKSRLSDVFGINIYYDDYAAIFSNKNRKEWLINQIISNINIRSRSGSVTPMFIVDVNGMLLKEDFNDILDLYTNIRYGKAIKSHIAGGRRHNATALRMKSREDFLYRLLEMDKFGNSSKYFDDDGKIIRDIVKADFYVNDVVSKSRLRKLYSNMIHGLDVINDTMKNIADELYKVQTQISIDATNELLLQRNNLLIKFNKLQLEFDTIFGKVNKHESILDRYIANNILHRSVFEDSAVASTLGGKPFLDVLPITRDRFLDINAGMIDAEIRRINRSNTKIAETIRIKMSGADEKLIRESIDKAIKSHADWISINYKGIMPDISNIISGIQEGKMLDASLREMVLKKMIQDYDSMRHVYIVEYAPPNRTDIENEIRAQLVGRSEHDIEKAILKRISELEGSVSRNIYLVDINNIKITIENVSKQLDKLNIIKSDVERSISRFNKHITSDIDTTKELLSFIRQIHTINILDIDPNIVKFKLEQQLDNIQSSISKLSVSKLGKYIDDIINPMVEEFNNKQTLGIFKDGKDISAIADIIRQSLLNPVSHKETATNSIRIAMVGGVPVQVAYEDMHAEEMKDTIAIEADIKLRSDLDRFDSEIAILQNELRDAEKKKNETYGRIFESRAKIEMELRDITEEIINKFDVDEHTFRRAKESIRHEEVMEEYLKLTGGAMATGDITGSLEYKKAAGIVFSRKYDQLIFGAGKERIVQELDYLTSALKGGQARLAQMDLVFQRWAIGLIGNIWPHIVNSIGTGKQFLQKAMEIKKDAIVFYTDNIVNTYWEDFVVIGRRAAAFNRLRKGIFDILDGRIPSGWAVDEFLLRHSEEWREATSTALRRSMKDLIFSSIDIGMRGAIRPRQAVQALGNELRLVVPLDQVSDTIERAMLNSRDTIRVRDHVRGDYVNNIIVKINDDIDSLISRIKDDILRGIALDSRMLTDIDVKETKIDGMDYFIRTKGTKGGASQKLTIGKVQELVRGHIIGTLDDDVDRMFRRRYNQNAQQVIDTFAVAMANHTMVAIVKHPQFNEILKGVEWVTIDDSHVCALCNDMDRRTWVINYVGKDGKIYTDEPDDLEYPPAHPGCRCALIPVLFSETHLHAIGMSPSDSKIKMIDNFRRRRLFKSQTDAELELEDSGQFEDEAIDTSHWGNVFERPIRRSRMFDPFRMSEGQQRELFGDKYELWKRGLLDGYDKDMFNETLGEMNESVNKHIIKDMSKRLMRNMLYRYGQKVIENTHLNIVNSGAVEVNDVKRSPSAFLKLRGTKILADSLSDTLSKESIETEICTTANESCGNVMNDIMEVIGKHNSRFARGVIDRIYGLVDKMVVQPDGTHKKMTDEEILDQLAKDGHVVDDKDAALSAIRDARSKSTLEDRAEEIDNATHAYANQRMSRVADTARPLIDRIFEDLLPFLVQLIKPTQIDNLFLMAGDTGVKAPKSFMLDEGITQALSTFTVTEGDQKLIGDDAILKRLEELLAENVDLKDEDVATKLAGEIIESWEGNELSKGWDEVMQHAHAMSPQARDEAMTERIVLELMHRQASVLGSEALNIRPSSESTLEDIITHNRFKNKWMLIDDKSRDAIWSDLKKNDRLPLLKKEMDGWDYRTQNARFYYPANNPELLSGIEATDISDDEINDKKKMKKRINKKSNRLTIGEEVVSTSRFVDETPGMEHSIIITPDSRIVTTDKRVDADYMAMELKDLENKGFDDYIRGETWIDHSNQLLFRPIDDVPEDKVGVLENAFSNIGFGSKFRFTGNQRESIMNGEVTNLGVAVFDAGSDVIAIDEPHVKKVQVVREFLDRLITDLSNADWSDKGSGRLKSWGELSVDDRMDVVKYALSNMGVNDVVEGEIRSKLQISQVIGGVKKPDSSKFEMLGDTTLEGAYAIYDGRLNAKEAYSRFDDVFVNNKHSFIDKKTGTTFSREEVINMLRQSGGPRDNDGPLFNYTKEAIRRVR
jgi:hypothetical protein